MKFLIVDTYYSVFLDDFYGRFPHLVNESYAVQWRSLMDQYFGTADFYSVNLKLLGHEAHEVVANCEPLQTKWAYENCDASSVSSWLVRAKTNLQRHFGLTSQREMFFKILFSQIKRIQPDVLHIQNVNWTDSSLLREARPYVKTIVGQIACPVAKNVDFNAYDLILSSFPHFVTQFRKQAIASEYWRLGFEPVVLKSLEHNASPYRVAFVGGLSKHHSERICLLENIAKVHPLDFWGYGIDEVAKDSPLKSKYHGEAWALDMYNVFYNSKVSLNHHIGTANFFANNMRLYETTGVGTLLVTDNKQNLSELFEPEKEVLVYSCPQECVELISFCLSNETTRAAIAKAGQERALRDHTYYNRMVELLDILERFDRWPEQFR